MSKLSWPQVTLFLGMFLIVTVGACTLIVMNKDVAVILTLTAVMGVPIITAAGAAMYQKLGQVQDTTNGNTTKMMTMIAELQESNARLALKLPADTPPEVLMPVERQSPDQTAVMYRGQGY